MPSPRCLIALNVLPESAVGILWISQTSEIDRTDRVLASSSRYLFLPRSSYRNQPVVQPSVIP